MASDSEKTDNVKLFGTSLVNCELNNDVQEIQTGVCANENEFRDVNPSDRQISIDNNELPDVRTLEVLEAGMPYCEPSLLHSLVNNPVVAEDDKMATPCSIHEINLNEPYFPEVNEPMDISPVEADKTCCACNAAVRSGKLHGVRKREEEEIIDCDRCGIDVENLPVKTKDLDMPTEDDTNRNIVLRSNEVLPSVDSEKTASLENQAILSAELLSVDRNHQSKSLSKFNMIQEDALNPRMHIAGNFKTIENDKADGVRLEQEQCTREKRSFSIKQNYKEKKHTEDSRYNSKEIKRKPVSTSLKNQVEPKLLPNFESFTVEEEEGSGGYGTVYRAKRKKDGLTLAIKCPHDNANRHHIKNEMRMLERFGGKNFVIRYEGSFKYGTGDCLVLEHVEHDRPEVLKKEIIISEVQWYGYCLFKALASLHKQGIIHRDVKPGNFLFSRKANKGFLIDFNLAIDLHQKYGSTDISTMSYYMGFNHAQLSLAKSLPPAKSRKLSTAKGSEAIIREAEKGHKSFSLAKSLKKKTNQNEPADLSTRNIVKSQGADISGITSAKDATSTRLPSAERLREPMPCQGRKELISLAQEAMQGPSHEVLRVPASKRKRVAAPPENLDKKLVYLTPMPLHSKASAVAGVSLMKNKVENKQKREGPCVGTKGFRAPEVLFRSPHQGPKLDIWSAGVTLLYLITGKSPFVGDPEQNIKDIANLRGSEDLWEVAKLHNRESSFPVELFDMKYLPSKKLRHWCALNTRKPDILEAVPRTFFDLIDKCLTVNPRLRISAEEALRHEFFAPCHEQFRKHRLLKQGLSLDLRTSILNIKNENCEGL